MRAVTRRRAIRIRLSRRGRVLWIAAPVAWSHARIMKWMRENGFRYAVANQSTNEGE